MVWKTHVVMSDRTRRLEQYASFLAHNLKPKAGQMTHHANVECLVWGVQGALRRSSQYGMYWINAASPSTQRSCFHACLCTDTSIALRLPRASKSSKYPVHTFTFPRDDPLPTERKTMYYVQRTKAARTAHNTYVVRTVSVTV